MLGRLLKEHLLLSVLFLVLFFGAGAPSAGAQQVSCNEGDPNCVCTLVPVGPIEGGRTRVLCTSTNPDGTTTTSVTNPNTGGNTTATTSADGQTIEQTTTAPESSGKCGLGNIGQCFLNLPGLLFSGLAFLLLTLSSLILGIAGVVFNWVVIRTVFQFALYFGTSPGMIVAWGVLRDISNIALLFAFIFMGIATILNTQAVEGYTAKKALPSLVIFAVLLNFSLFATQGVIDVANGFSSVFSSYAGEQCSTATSGVGENGQTNADCANIGISSKILEAAGMHQIIPSGEQAVSAFSHAWDQPYTYSVMLIILSIMVTVTAMVLFAASIMLIIRVVVLSLLMVTSPIGFAGMAIPALHGIAKDWWHKLINQAFFAPVYLLLVFISIKLVDTLQDGQATVSDAIMGNTAAAGATTAGNMQVVVVFMVVIGFMIAALMVAQKMGAYGAGFATKTAAGLTFGAHAFVARRTVGRYSGHVAENLRKSPFGHTEAGRFLTGFADKGAGASFDVRGNSFAKVPGVDTGAAHKGGYNKIVHDAEEARTKHAKSLKQTDADIARESVLLDEKERGAELESASNKALTDQKKEVQKKVSEKESEHKAAALVRADERKPQEDKLKAALQRGDKVAAKREEAALNTMTAQHRTQVADEEKEIAELRAPLEEAERLHDERMDTIKKRRDQIEEEINGKLSRDGKHVLSVGVGSKAASYRYAKNLHDTQGSLINTVSAGGKAGHHAAGAILKSAGRSKIESALNTIKEETEKGSGGGHSAPTATPKATSGGPAPATGSH